MNENEWQKGGNKKGGLYKNARVSEEKSLLQSLIMQFNFECIISMHQQ